MTAPAAPPQVAVVVASHARPRRLGILLDALAAQRFPRGAFEVVVVHDDGPGETEALLAGHPLVADGTLRRIAVEQGTGSAARMRNLGYRATRAPLVAFTDDDCRPTETWLAELCAGARRHPGAILQGTTLPDPRDAAVLHSGRLTRTQAVRPTTLEGETCNIAYPRALLDATGGFDETFRRPWGEDTDLLWRARRLGADHVAVPDALTHHAVERITLMERLRWGRQMEQFPLILRRYPEYRRARGLAWRWLMTSSHGLFLLAVAGLIGAVRRPVLALLVAPYFANTWRNLRAARRRAWRQLPARAVITAGDVFALARGSVRNRVLFL